MAPGMDIWHASSVENSNSFIVLDLSLASIAVFLEGKFIWGIACVFVFCHLYAKHFCRNSLRDFECKGIICLCFHDNKNPNQSISVDPGSLHSKSGDNLGLCSAILKFCHSGHGTDVPPSFVNVA